MPAQSPTGGDSIFWKDLKNFWGICTWVWTLTIFNPTDPSIEEHSTTIITDNEIKPRILKSEIRVWEDCLPPTIKLAQILSKSETAYEMEFDVKDLIFKNLDKRPLDSIQKRVPKWVLEDHDIYSLIGKEQWTVVFFINYSDETIDKLKPKFHRWYVYFDWENYLVKRIKVKNISWVPFRARQWSNEEFSVMTQEQFESVWIIDMDNFLD